MQDLDIKFQAIFDYLDHPVYISDPKTYEILYFNKKIEEIVSGIEMGRKCYQVLQGFDSPCFFCTNGHQKARFEVAIDITELKNKENEIKNYSENLEKLIEERTKELQESAEKYKAISEKANDLITIFDEDFIYEYVNEKQYS